MTGTAYCKMSIGTREPSAERFRDIRWAISLGAQFFASALDNHPEILSEIEVGKFDTLHGWLKENIYQHGCKFTASEIVQRVTGSPLRIEPYISYLRQKYGELYELPA